MMAWLGPVLTLVVCALVVWRACVTEVMVRELEDDLLHIGRERDDWMATAELAVRREEAYRLIALGAVCYMEKKHGCKRYAKAVRKEYEEAERVIVGEETETKGNA